MQEHNSEAEWQMASLLESLHLRIPNNISQEEELVWWRMSYKYALESARTTAVSVVRNRTLQLIRLELMWLLQLGLA